MNNVIGLDLGMGATKLWSSAGGTMVLSQVAAVTRQDIDLKALGMTSRKRPTVILNGAGRMLVGEGAHDAGTPIERLDYERLTGSPEIKALVYNVLSSQHTDENTPISLIVGLPLGLATDGDQGEGKRRVDAVKDWLKGAHVWKADGVEHVAVVDRVGCVGQAHGAYFDWLLDLHGRRQNKPGRDEEIGVISIGFNTVELVVLKDNKAVERFVDGEQIGVRRYLELVNEKRRRLFSLGELDIRLRNGSLHDDAELGKWVAQVHGRIESQWGKAAQRFDRIIAVGGGAIVLRDALADLFGNRLVDVDDPVMSIARGLYKFGVMRNDGQAGK